MKSIGITLTKVSTEQMLNDTENSAYNVSTWKESVYRYAKYPKCQFYVVPKDETFKYPRFYVSYVADGIYFFSQWNAFSASLTSNPFCKVFIDTDGLVWKQLFKFSDGSEGGISKTKEGRDFIRKQISSQGIMVSSCI